MGVQGLCGVCGLVCGHHVLWNIECVWCVCGVGMCGGFWVGGCVLSCWRVVWGCINHCLMVVWCLLCSGGLILVGWARQAGVISSKLDFNDSWLLNEPCRLKHSL